MTWICFPSNVLVSKSARCICIFLASASLGVARQLKTPPNSWTLSSLRDALKLLKANVAAVKPAAVKPSLFIF